MTSAFLLLVTVFAVSFSLTSATGCCKTLEVSVESFGSWPGHRSWVGVYRPRGETHNNKPVYEHEDGYWCIFYRVWWKVDTCNFLTPENINLGSVGYLYSKANKDCPENIGSQWSFYPYSNVATPARGGEISCGVQCQDGWDHFNGRCYYFSKQTASWDEARQECKKQNPTADLASINSEQELDFILKSVKGYGRVYIGGTDAQSEGKWSWVDGSPWEYTNWYKNEPNNAGNEDCAELESNHEGVWNDIPCYLKYGFVCAYKPGCLITGNNYWWDDVCLEGGEGIPMPWYECGQYCRDNCPAAKAWVYNPERNGGGCWCKTRLSNIKPKPGKGYYAGTIDCLPNTESDDCHCGLAKRRPTRIVGGVETEVNEYPWQVRLSRGCGGSLISDQWVVTAAHCVDGFTTSTLTVYLGEHDLTDEDEADTIQMELAEIIFHDQYKSNNPSRFDFALLKMKNKINFDSHPHIRPICLPAEGSNNDYSGYTATATGWGQTEYYGPSLPYLLEVDLTVVTKTMCESWYGSTDIDQVLCAKGDGGKGICFGDSGGPLVTKEAGNTGTVAGQNYELIGVTSFTRGGTCKDTLQGFARVTAQLDWIREKTKDSWRTCPRT